jgi:hypothetical protein
MTGREADPGALANNQKGTPDMTEPLWREFRPSAWVRSDGAAAAQPHGLDDHPEADYWHALPSYITGDRPDVGHLAQVMRRRFKSKEAAMAYVDKAWPPG